MQTVNKSQEMEGRTTRGHTMKLSKKRQEIYEKILLQCKIGG